MNHHVVRLCGILLLAGTTATAVAQEGRTPAQLFTSGQRHYNLSEWQAALDDFKTAYRQKPDPALLFNIAQCYRQLGRPADAANEYRAYLRETPDAPNRDEVERLIRAMDVSVRAAMQPPLSVAAPSAAAPASTRSVDPRTERVAGIALMSGGAALVAVGGIFVGLAYSANGKADQNGVYQPQQINQRNTFEALDATAFAVGGAAAVTGAVLFFLGRRSDRYAAAPAVSSGFVGVRATGRF